MRGGFSITSQLSRPRTSAALAGCALGTTQRKESKANMSDKLCRRVMRERYVAIVIPQYCCTGDCSKLTFTPAGALRRRLSGSALHELCGVCHRMQDPSPQEEENKHFQSER